MRIFHLLNHIQEIGNGIVNVTIDLACLQAKSGHTVAIASGGGEYEALLAEYQITHFQLDQGRNPRKILTAIQRYRQIIHEFNPEVVHVHMMTGVVLAKLLRGSSRYQLVSTVHNEFQRHAILMGWADRVIAISQAVAEAMIQRGVSPQKIHVVRNGTLGSPRDRCSALPDLPSVTLQHPAIVTVAGLYRRKGIAELIAAFDQIAPQFPEAHLYLVGNGPDRALFEAQAQHSPVCSRIHFEGFQPQPQRYLQETDIFVLASQREPFGLVLAEARQAGCAIVATAVDGVPEVLEGGRAGILVPPAVEQLAAAIAHLLAHPEQRTAWRTQAQTNLQWLSVARMAEETLAVYQSGTENE